MAVSLCRFSQGMAVWLWQGGYFFERGISQQGQWPYPQNENVISNIFDCKMLLCVESHNINQNTRTVTEIIERRFNMLTSLLSATFRKQIFEYQNWYHRTVSATRFFGCTVAWHGWMDLKKLTAVINRCNALHLGSFSLMKRAIKRNHDSLNTLVYAINQLLNSLSTTGVESQLLQVWTLTWKNLSWPCRNSWEEVYFWGQEVQEDDEFWVEQMSCRNIFASHLLGMHLPHKTHTKPNHDDTDSNTIESTSSIRWRLVL